jgi:hypothetical protein
MLEIYISHKIIVKIVIDVAFVPRIFSLTISNSRLLGKIDTLVVYKALIARFKLVFVEVLIHFLLVLSNLLVRKLVKIGVFVVEIV